ncbi:MAG TPA: F0F1 ATP synthase subunit epsilon [Candidatus Binatia bacterium]|nr:F0F1 ATP synthase subunit epsilon [Candidatus Binatia bacterium]
MAETLRLRVVTPERLLLDEEVDEVTAPGTEGEFGVLPNHITFLSSLQPGRLSYKQGGQAHFLAVSGGFAEVRDNVVTVLTDSAEFANEIDVERARAALRAAEESLRTLAVTDPVFVEVQAAQQRARVRIEVAGSVNGR